MRLSFRFIIPLALVLAAIAYAVVPVGLARAVRELADRGGPG